MSAHTPGPWEQSRTFGQQGLIGPRDGFPVASVTGYYTRNGQSEANARLIAAAPAMDLALRLIAGGYARIERTGSLREFCFDGIRYSMNDDWSALFDVIGWNRANAKATGERP